MLVLLLDLRLCQRRRTPRTPRTTGPQVTAPKGRRTSRPAPPGWYHLQDAARAFGVSPNTMTKWITSGVILTGHPDGQRRLVPGHEISRVLRLLREQP